MESLTGYDGMGTSHSKILYIMNLLIFGAFEVYNHLLSSGTKHDIAFFLLPQIPERLRAVLQTASQHEGVDVHPPGLCLRRRLRLAEVLRVLHRRDGLHGVLAHQGQHQGRRVSEESLGRSN